MTGWSLSMHAHLTTVGRSSECSRPRRATAAAPTPATIHHHQSTAWRRALPSTRWTSCVQLDWRQTGLDGWRPASRRWRKCRRSWDWTTVTEDRRDEFDARRSSCVASPLRPSRRASSDCEAWRYCCCCCCCWWWRGRRTTTSDVGGQRLRCSAASRGPGPVSYTHLTLPTILRV